MANRARHAMDRTARGPQTRANVAGALHRLTREHGRPPTLREVGDATGLRSVNAVWYHLQDLRDMGVVRHLGGVRGYVMGDGWLQQLHQAEKAGVSRAGHK